MMCVVLQRTVAKRDQLGKYRMLNALMVVTIMYTLYLLFTQTLQSQVTYVPSFYSRNTKCSVPRLGPNSAFER